MCGISARKGRTKTKQQTRIALVNKPACIVSATQAARTFSDLLNRVRYRGESFVIERGGEPICEMAPVKPPRFSGADLLDLLDAASSVTDMNFPGSGLHRLRGKMKTFWAVKVSGNWRVIFQFRNGNAFNVNYVDYH